MDELREGFEDHKLTVSELETKRDQLQAALITSQEVRNASLLCS